MKMANIRSPHIPQTAVLGLMLLAVLCVTLTLQPTIWLQQSLREVNVFNRPGRVRRKIPDGSYDSIWYWTPHKTSSSSLRGFFKRLATIKSFEAINFNCYYPYCSRSYLDEALSGAPQKIYYGHHHVKNFNSTLTPNMIPPNILSVSSIRLPLDVMTSKYFHRTSHELEDPSIFKDIRGAAARQWYFHWHDYNLCEPLEYYDGDRNCDLHSLDERIERISEVVDCVIDADDSRPDVEAICKKFDVKECPGEINANVHGASLYGDLHKIEHILEVLVNASGPTEMLYNRLKQKRCRTFL